MPKVIFCCTLLFSVYAASLASAQLPTGWKAHDWDRSAPQVVVPGDATIPGSPPSDAVVLFDGSNLDAWCDSEGKPSKWKIVDGVMESVAGSGYIFTKQSFGDMQLHVEWASPSKVEGDSQGRGNSGVFLMGQFEVQVLDSFDNRTYADGQAASVYGQYPPLVNASRKPGEWQTYDIIFHRAKFDAAGNLTEKASITVLHNGVLVQDHTRPLGPTSWIQHKPYKDIGPKAPLSFQDHGNPVRFRNVWVRELSVNPYPGPTQAYDQATFVPSNEELDKLAGSYGKGEWSTYRIRRVDRKLHLQFVGNDFALVAHSPTEFQLPFTAATIKFQMTDDGKPKSLEFIMGGSTTVAERREEASASSSSSVQTEAKKAEETKKDDGSSANDKSE